MPFDILGYQKKYKDEYGDAPLEDVAKDVFSRAGYDKEYPDYDTWKKAKGIDSIIQEDNQKRNPSSILGEIPKGLEAGVQQVKGMGYGLGTLAGEALNSDILKKWGAEGLADVEKETPKPQVASFTDIKSGSDLAKYLAYGISTNIPSMAISFGTGGIGGLIGKKVAQTAITEGLEKTVANKIIQSGITKGAVAGAGVGSIGMEAGSIAGDQLQETGKVDPLRAMAGAIPAGLLDVLPEYKLAKSLGWLGKDAVDFAGNRFVQALKEGAKQFLWEAPTEAMQSVFERAAVPGKSITNEDARNEYINSFILGGLTGAVVGGGAHLTTGLVKGDQIADSDKEAIDRLQRGASLSGMVYAGMKEGTVAGNPFTPDDAIKIIQHGQKEGLFDDADIDRFRENYPSLRDGLNGVVVDNLMEKVNQVVSVEPRSDSISEVTKDMAASKARREADVPDFQEPEEINKEAINNEQTLQTETEIRNLKESIAKQTDYLDRHSGYKGTDIYKTWEDALVRDKVRLAELTGGIPSTEPIKPAEELKTSLPAITSPEETENVSGQQEIVPSAASSQEGAEKPVDKGVAEDKKKFTTSEEVQNIIDEYEDELAQKYGDDAVRHAPLFGQKAEDLPYGPSPLAESEINELSRLYEARDSIDKKDLTTWRNTVVKDSGLPKGEIEGALKTLGFHSTERDTSVYSTAENLRGFGKNSTGTLGKLYTHFAKELDPQTTVHGKFRIGGTAENPVLEGKSFDSDMHETPWDKEALAKTEKVYNAIARTQSLPEVNLKNIGQQSKAPKPSSLPKADHITDTSKLIPAEIFIRLAERKDLGKANTKSLEAIPNKEGYDKVYRQYDAEGKRKPAFYYVKTKGKPVKAAKKPAPRTKGTQNLVTKILELGGLKVTGKDYNTRLLRQDPDAKRVLRMKSGLTADQLASRLQADGWAVESGDHLVELLKSGQGRTVYAPEIIDDKLNREAERETHEWANERVKELEAAGFDAGTSEKSRADIKAGLITALEEEGYSSEQIEVNAQEVEDFFSTVSAVVAKKEAPKGDVQPNLEGLSPEETFTLNNPETEISPKLSEQVTPKNADMFGENKKQFIVSPDGEIDFGQIPIEIEEKSEGRFPSAPIRLEKGSKWEYGHEHISPERKQEIIDIGYKDELDMLSDVAKNFTQIYEQPNGRLLLVRKNGKSKYAVVELQQKSNNYYGATTWFLDEKPLRGKPYEERSGRKLLLDVARTADSGKPAPFASASNKDRAGENWRSGESSSPLKNNITPLKETVNKETETVKHNRSAAPTRGISTDRVKLMSDKITSFLNINPKIRIAQHISDLPREVLDHMKEKGILDEGGDSDVNGFAWKGEAWLVSDNIRDDVDAFKTIMHELTHNGVGNLFNQGPKSVRWEYNKLMDSIISAHKQDIEDIAQTTHTHLKLSTIEGRRAAAEEWLCNQSYQSQAKWYDKLVTIFHDFIRAIGIDVKLSDSEVRTILRDAFKTFRESKTALEKSPESAMIPIMTSRKGTGNGHWWDGRDLQKEIESVPRKYFEKAPNPITEGWVPITKAEADYLNSKPNLRGNTAVFDTKPHSEMTAEEQWMRPQNKKGMTGYGERFPKQDPEAQALYDKYKERFIFGDVPATGRENNIREGMRGDTGVQKGESQKGVGEETPKYSIRKPQDPPVSSDPKVLNLYLKDETDAIRQVIFNKFHPKNMTWLETMLKSPEYFDHPVISKIVKLFMRDRSEIYHETFNNLDEAKTPFMEQKTVSGAAKALKGKGMSLADRITGKESAEYKHLIKILEEGDTEWKRDISKPLTEQIKAFEDHIRKQGATDDTIAVWKLYRQSYDKALDLQTQQIRDMIKQVSEEGAAKGVTPDIRELMQTLKGALAQMEEWKGFYVPRIREQGDWKVQAYKDHGPYTVNKEYYREHVGSELAAQRLAKKLEREGWKITNVGTVEKLPEGLYQDVNLAATAKLIDAALKKMNQTTELKMETTMKLNEDILQAVADEIRARGFRSHMIHRGSAIVKGYIEDPIKRHILYMNQLSGGISKAQVARQAMEELLGKEVIGSREGGIDPVKEPREYEVATNYMREQLRNLDASDRMIGIAKSIATFKFLGFNVRSAFVNTTAIVTTAPAAIHQYVMGGKGSMTQVFRELGKAGKDYGAVMAGKGHLNANEQNFIDDMHKKGWDDAQYTRDALGTMQKAHSLVWAKMMDSSMYLFGKTEQWNRGATMLAAYRVARKQGLNHAEASEKAHDASDKAHGVYGRATMPMWAQGANPAAKIGQMMYVYSKFSHNYLQMLYDMGFKKHNIKGVMFAFLSPLVLAGGAALPFKDAIFGVAGVILKALFGWDQDPEKWVWDEIRKHLGTGAEKIGRHGLTGAAGIDISGSLSIGVGIPKKFIDLTGAVGGVYEDVMEFGENFGRGQYSKAAEKLLPAGAANPIRAIRESSEGVTTKNNRRVWDENGKPFIPGTAAAVARAVGFRSTDQAVLSERTWEGHREQGKFAEKRNAIYERFRAWTLGGRDRDEYKKIVKEVQDYNRQIRENRIRGVSPITSDSLRNQTKRMQKPSKNERAILQ